MTTERIFTPFEHPTSNHRLKMNLSDEDYRHIGRGRWGPVEVTDLNTGVVVEVRGASCGSATCFCAAEVVRVVSGDLAEVERFD
jgi:hypothetical protein